MTLVTIHQPNYLPYLGFFDKVKRSDVFIIHDDCQFTPKLHQHRNKIRLFKGWKWLTVPVIKEEIPINEIKINDERGKNQPIWTKKHYNDIVANYTKTPYFPSFVDDIKDIYSKNYENLVDVNMKIIKFLLEAFKIYPEIALASEFSFKTTKTQKIIDLVNAVEGDVYISGIGGKEYLDLSKIKNFKVIFQNYNHPVYQQRFPGFEPYMAAIDALFNIGKLPENINR